MTPTPDAVLAAELVRNAGRLALEMRRAGVDPVQKTSISDLVTAADHAAEELIVARLRELRPDDAIVGEEGTEQLGTSGRRWVIDPVDGTYNYVSGLDWWCSAIALADDESVILGAVHHPHDDILWLGGPQLPTTRNGVAVAPIADRPLAELGAATYLHPTYLDVLAVRDAWSRAAAETATVRMLGSASMDLAGVADGRVGIWFQHSAPDWDWLPGKALVAGAGGATAQVDAGGVRWSVAGPPTAVDQLVAALGSERPHG